MDSDKSVLPAAFQAFSWLRDDENKPANYFLDDARNLACGVKVVLQILQKNGLEMQAESQPFLDVGAADSLLLFAMTSAKLLEEVIDEHIDYLNRNSLDREIEKNRKEKK